MSDEEQDPAETTADDLPPGEPAEDSDPLSPSVRRLVKAYGLDISAIRGSGPSGRIRVGDVMAALGSRASTGTATADERAAMRLMASGGDDLDAAAETATADALAADTAVPPRVVRAAGPAAAAVGPLAGALPAAQRVTPATTVFECDVGGVLAHRQRGRGVEVALATHFVAAAIDALRAVPEANASRDTVNVAVHGMREGQPATRVVRGAERLSFEALNDALSSHDRSSQTEAAGAADTTVAIYDYGAFGSVLAAPTPLAAGHAACIGIGKPRRQVVMRNNSSGEDTPRAVALCYVSLSYDPERLAFERANLYLARIVRAIERWQQA